MPPRVRKTNAENVRSYYVRHKHTVLFRKVMKRCRNTGAMPHIESVRKYDIPILGLMVAFADWVVRNPTATYLIARQGDKLNAIRKEFAAKTHAEFERSTAEDRQIRDYLDRVTRQSAEINETQRASQMAQCLVGRGLRDLLAGLIDDETSASSSSSSSSGA